MHRTIMIIVIISNIIVIGEFLLSHSPSQYQTICLVSFLQRDLLVRASTCVSSKHNGSSSAVDNAAVYDRSD